MTGEELIAEAINRVADNLFSPNEEDANFEPANVVDGLYFIGRGLERIAEALEKFPGLVERNG